MTLHRPRGTGGVRPEELELRCAEALARGDSALAFALADRRCRMPQQADAHSHVLRAEALRATGNPSAALADLETALAITPEDLAANRRMLGWGEGETQRRAARTLIAVERDPAVLCQAIDVLQASGARAFGMLQRFDTAIEGWAVWPDGELFAALETENGERVIPILPDDRHALAGVDRLAAAFRFDFDPGLVPNRVVLRHGGAELARLRLVPPVESRPAESADGVVADVTVIVPVYKDAEATGRCLASLLEQLAGQPRYRVTVVDDASPELQVRALLRTLEGWPGVTVLRNADNLGFVGAVNRALAAIPSGDVVLLNADTIVPPGFIDRLAAATRAAPDIGTVTPLSNNGEFTSFPLPNRPNPDEPLIDLWQIDAVAARVNAGSVIDLPNGIGFCLYITRACLDAVGPLSAGFDRGYLEDVDFCLRASRLGFRNVCAASVYVGHAGSRSFGDGKRALVTRNLAVIEQKYPDYRRACADFLLADPLQAVRHAIEAEMVPAPGATLLVVCGEGAVAEIAAARAQRLNDLGVPTVTLHVRFGGAGAQVLLRAAGGGAPQSLAFKLASEVEALGAWLGRASWQRVEFFDLARLPRTLLDTLCRLGVPSDIALCHVGLFGQPGAPGDAHCREIVRSAGRLLVPDEQAARFADGLAPGVACELLDLGLPEVAPSTASGQTTRIGLLVPVGNAAAAALVRGLSVELRRRCPDLALMLFGDWTWPDVPGLWVTGGVSAAELADALRYHAIDRVLVCQTLPLFGHPIVAAARATSLPLAGPDWSDRGGCARPGDLVFPSGSSVEAVADRVVPWLASQELP